MRDLNEADEPSPSAPEDDDARDMRRQRFPGPPVLLKTQSADEEAQAEASAAPVTS